jgi:hypothetical protein
MLLSCVHITYTFAQAIDAAHRFGVRAEEKLEKAILVYTSIINYRYLLKINYKYLKKIDAKLNHYESG